MKVVEVFPDHIKKQLNGILSQQNRVMPELSVI